jgi:mono/diheme cytochrome c family protein
VFASNCAGCHGADGTGGVGPDLTTLAAAADEATVVKQVTNGGQIMPSFSGTLSSQQIQDVAAYVSKDLAGH